MRRAGMPERSLIMFSSESEASPPKKKLRSSHAGAKNSLKKPGDTICRTIAKDSSGQRYSVEEQVTNNTGGVQFIIHRGNTPLFGCLGSYDRASFSCSTADCKGKTVKLDRFQLPKRLRRKGHGTWALRIILALYQQRGCACIEVPAPTHQGKGLYKKCGFSDDHHIGLRYDFTKERAPTRPLITPAVPAGQVPRRRLSRSLFSGIKQVRTQRLSFLANAI